MSTTTPNLTLTLYDSTTDQVVTFATFRAVWGGTATTSNFYRIDTWAGTVNSSITTLQNQRGAITVPASYVSANYYEATVASITSYITGMTILLKLDTDSAGTVTLNINALGTKSVTKVNSSGSIVNITGAELQSNRYYMFTYDGTQWVWVDAQSSDQIVVVGGTSGNVLTVASDGSIEGTITKSSLLSSTINSATSKTTPVDNDEFGIVDSEASNVLKKLSFANLKATFLNYFNTYYRNQYISGSKLIWNSGTSLSVGTGSCYAENGDFINITSTLTASSLSLSNSTWYHIYVYLSSGSPAMEVVTTAPVSWKGSAYSKTGDTSRRYVGSVKTNSSASVYKFTHNLESNMIVYQNAALNASPFRCLTTGTATTATSVSLSGVVPVTSTFVNLRLVNTSDQTVYTNSDNSVSTTSFQMVLVAGNVVQTTLLNIHPTDSSQNVYYYFPVATGSGGANLDVYGYFYDR